jgi:hypothetical protein
MSLIGIDDDPKAARRRLGPVQDDADLHTPTVSALAAGNISQLADACDAGAATRYECLTTSRSAGPKEMAASTWRRRPTWRGPPVKADPGRNRPRISSPPAGHPMLVCPDHEETIMSSSFPVRIARGDDQPAAGDSVVRMESAVRALR